MTKSAGRSHQPALRAVWIHSAASGATGDAFLFGQALIKHSTVAPPRLREDDESLFAYVDTLRLSVKAKVAADQRSGLSLSEIVVQVREMVRLASEARDRPEHFPMFAFPAMSRQAVAWCVEAYQPVLFAASDVHSAESGESNDEALRPVLPVTVEALDRFSAHSNNPVGDDHE